MEKTLTSRDGAPHAYLFTPIPPSRGLDLALNILACIARPGVRVVKLSMEAQGIDLDDELQLSKFIAAVDLSQFGDDLETVLLSLAERPDLVRRLFHGTFRDKKDLSDDVSFDEAYQNNWGELYAALKEIVQVNGLIPFLDSLSS